MCTKPWVLAHSRLSRWHAPVTPAFVSQKFKIVLGNMLSQRSAWTSQNLTSKRGRGDRRERREVEREGRRAGSGRKERGERGGGEEGETVDGRREEAKQAK